MTTPTTAIDDNLHGYSSVAVDNEKASYQDVVGDNTNNGDDTNDSN